MKNFRLPIIISWLAGLGLLAWLLQRQGIGDVLTVLSLAGFNILWLGIYRIVPITLDALGWRELFSQIHRPPFNTLIQARWIGESVNTLFPVAQVGGHILRARIVGKKKDTNGEAGATVMVDFTMGLTTQILFTILGVILLLFKKNSHIGTSSIISGIVVAMLLIGGFFLSQRAGLFTFLARSLSRLQRKKTSTMVNGALTLDEKIAQIYGNTNKLSPCLCWRLGGWLAKSGENWLFFYFLGAPISLREAIILESLCTAFRSAAFFIPGGLGIQDGSLLIIGSMLGLEASSIMALALGKRFRELIVGLPGLLWWFIFESRNLKNR